MCNVILKLVKVKHWTIESVCCTSHVFYDVQGRIKDRLRENVKVIDGDLLVLSAYFGVGANKVDDQQEVLTKSGKNLNK